MNLARKSISKNKKQEKQYRLSLWLKAVDIILCILVVVGYIVLTWYGRTGSGQTAADIRAYGGLIYITGALAIIIFLIFWRVATEIGRGNSFSLENVDHFRHMGFCGSAISISYLLRLFYVLAEHQATAFRIGYCLAMLVVGLLFLSICFILSSLIQNAYEMKQENDLTI